MTNIPSTIDNVADNTAKYIGSLSEAATVAYNSSRPDHPDIEFHPYFPSGIEIKADSNKGLLSDLAYAALAHANRIAKEDRVKFVPR